MYISFFLCIFHSRRVANANPICSGIEVALGLLALAMYISCIFHVVCASFSALATRKLADAEANSSGIWAVDFGSCLMVLKAKFDIFVGEKKILEMFATQRLLCYLAQRDHTLPTGI